MLERNQLQLYIPQLIWNFNFESGIRLILKMSKYY